MSNPLAPRTSRRASPPSTTGSLRTTPASPRVDWPLASGVEGGLNRGKPAQRQPTRKTPSPSGRSDQSGRPPAAGALTASEDQPEGSSCAAAPPAARAVELVKSFSHPVSGKVTAALRGSAFNDSK